MQLESLEITFTWPYKMGARDIFVVFFFFLLFFFFTANWTHARVIGFVFVVVASVVVAWS